MSKISELSDGGALQSTDYLIAVRSGGNVKVQANGAASFTTLTASGDVNFDSGTFFVDASADAVGIGTSSPSALVDVNSGAVTAYASPSLNLLRNHGGQAYQNLAGTQFYWNTSNGSGESEIVYGNLGTSYLRFLHNNAGSFSERMRLDAAGNLGLGAVPAAWGTSYKALQFASGAITGFSTTALDLYGNAYDSGTGAWKYLNSSQGATRYAAFNGQHQWFNAPSGTAGNAISFTQAMTLDASGRLGIGASSPGAELDINRPTSTACYARVGNGGNVQAYIGVAGDNLPVLGSYTNHALRFVVNTSEVARFDTSGYFKVGNNDSLSGKPAGVICPIGYVGRSGTSGSVANVFNIYWNGSAPELWIDTSNIGTISISSDYRIKKNVKTQTEPALERLMRLRPITYELADYGSLFKADGVQREGFIAHEVQEVIPSGAEGHKDEENRVQSLKLDAILSVAVKAIQEQQEIINDLRARVAQLEGA